MHYTNIPMNKTNVAVANCRRCRANSLRMQLTYILLKVRVPATTRQFAGVLFWYEIAANYLRIYRCIHTFTTMQLMEGFSFSKVFVYAEII